MSQFPPPSTTPVDNKKVLCGVFGILFGGLAVHRFILGDVSGGLIRILITICTCGMGGIIGLIEGIIYLTKSDADFMQIYQVDKKKWF